MAVKVEVGSCWRDKDWRVSSEREGKFVRYRLVGKGADSARDPRVSALSSEAVKRSVPSMFDCDDAVDWGER